MKLTQRPLSVRERSLPATSKIEVDTERGVIRNVKLLGWESKNPASVLRLSRTEFGAALDEPYSYSSRDAAVALPYYDRVQVFEDHPTDDMERSVRTLVGETSNPRIEVDGIYGDICYLRETETGRRLAEVAQRMPHQLGCSHVATGIPELVEGRVVITGYRPESVDVVTRPATTRGLHESIVGERDMAKARPKRKLRDAILATPKDTRYRTRLLEMIDDELVDGDIAVAEPEGEEGGSPEDLIRQGLIAAINEKLASATDEEIQAVLAALGIESPMASGEAEEADTEESLRVRHLEAKALLLESYRKATTERIEAVAAMPAARRKVLVQSWPRDLLESQGKRRSEPSRPAVVSSWESENEPSEAYRRRVERLLSE